MGWVTLTQRKAELKQQHIYYQNRDLQISREKRQMARRKMFEESTINAALKNEEITRKQEYYTRKNELEKEKAALKEYLSIAKNIQAGHVSPSDVIEMPRTNGSDIFITGSNYDETNSNAVFVDGQPLLIYEDGTDLCFAKADGSGGFVDATTGNPLPTGVTPSGPANPSHIDSATLSATFDPSYTLPTGSTITYGEVISIPAISLSGSLSSITQGSDISSIETEINNALDDISLNLDNARLEYTEDLNDIKSSYETELQMLEEDSADEELVLDQEQMEVETMMENISNELQSISDAASQQMQGSTIRLA